MKNPAVLMIALLAATIGLYSLSASPPVFSFPDESELRPVDSEVFRSMAYRGSTETLTLVFHNGYAYEYAGVPRACYESLVLSRAKGSYFNRRIRGYFPCRRIDAE